MHAIIRLGEEKYYCSAVFGYVCRITAVDDYQRYLEGIHNQYYLVLNQEKDRLIKQVIFPWGNKYLNPTILIVDDDDKDWVTIEKGLAVVDFLAGENLESVQDTITPALLKKCIGIDAAYRYEEYPEIREESDIKRLMSAAGGFHDACIAKLERSDDGSVYLLFDGTWGCTIEIWLEGDVSYCAESRNPKQFDPYWSCAAVLMKDGYVYIVDDDVEVEDITDDYCWFKAKRMKYHIIPN